MRVVQSLAHKGSQKWIQCIVNENSDFLNSEVLKALPILPKKIAWLSPKKEDNYAEYRDEDFINLLGIKLSKVSLEDFWPKGGPQWDALGKSENSDIFIVEAKSHIAELISPGTKATYQSAQKIGKSLNRVKTYLDIKNKIDWATSLFYQYVNRLAHLYLLRILNNIPAYLVFIYFINDKKMNGPGSAEEWRAAIKLVRACLGIKKGYLERYIANVFIDIRNIPLERIVKSNAQK